MKNLIQTGVNRQIILYKAQLELMSMLYKFRLGSIEAPIVIEDDKAERMWNLSFWSDAPIGLINNN